MAVHLLSLPGSTLVPSSDDQPHRINLCYRAPSYPANQRVWLTDRDFNHGFQTRYRSPETLAPTQRIRFAPKSGHRRPFYRRRGTARTSCLTVINRGCAFFPYTTFDNISFRHARFSQSLVGRTNSCFGRALIGAAKHSDYFRIRMSVRRNFEMGWKLDALNDCLCFRWISDQDDGLRALEYRVLFPNQLISRYDLHGILRDTWHSKADCQSCKGK